MYNLLVPFNDIYTSINQTTFEPKLDIMFENYFGDDLWNLFNIEITENRDVKLIFKNYDDYVYFTKKLIFDNF